MHKYYIIEHPTRGVYVKGSYESRPIGLVFRAKFSWSIQRSKGIHYYSIQECINQMTKFSDKLKSKCYIVEFPGGKIIK